MADPDLVSLFIVLCNNRLSSNVSLTVVWSFACVGRIFP